MSALLQDLRHALRLLRRTPGVTAAAILSLAVTIGITGVVFTALKNVVLDPLPYKDPSRLIVMRTDGRLAYWVTYSDMVDVRRRNRTLQSLGIYHYALLNLRGDARNPPQGLYGLAVTSDLFPTLGVTPMIGRNVTPEDEIPGHDHVLILSYGLWQRRFNCDRAVLGRTITLNGYVYTVIGVMPPGFDFPLRIASPIRTPSRYMEFWTALVDKPDRTRGCGAVARLRPGVTMAEAQQDLAAIGKQLQKEYPLTNKDRDIQVFSLERQTLGNTRPALLILMAAALMFMLIGCSNVANLLLSRSLARRREIAVRLALGAARARLVRQLLTESSVLALAGGLCGYLLLLAAWRVLPAIVPTTIPRLESAHPDWSIFLFTVGVSVVNGFIFGIAPALRTAGHDPANALRDSGGRGAIGPARNRLRSAFVISEMAITMVLVIAGGLLVSSFAALVHTDLGFRADHVLASIIVPQGETYKTTAARASLYKRIVEDARRLPGVESAGTVDALPFSGENFGSTVAAGSPKQGPQGKFQTAETDRVSAGYLQTMGIRLLRGRWFRPQDEADDSLPAIIDENAARRFFPGQDPIGQYICLNCEPGHKPEWKQVVGVVNSIKHYSVQGPPDPEVYHAAAAYEHAQFLVLRTRGPAGDLVAPLRRIIASLDPNVAVYISEELKNLVGDSMSDRRFVMALLAVTAALALLLAAAGIYAVMSYATSQRTQEIGIRMALGASSANVQGLVLRDGMRMAASGVSIGFAAALIATRLLRATLLGVGANPVFTIGLAVIVVVVTALLACLLPARRATRIDPMAALRDV